MQEVMQDHRNEMKKMHEAMQEQFRRALQEQQNVIMGALWKLRENQQQLLELLKQDVPPLQNSKDQDDLEDLQQPQFQKPQPVLQFQQQLHPQYQIQQQQMGPDDEQQPKRSMFCTLFIYIFQIIIKSDYYFNFDLQNEEEQKREGCFPVYTVFRQIVCG